MGEYLKSLRERHNLKHKSKKMNVKLGIVVKLFQGRDGVVRAVRLRAGKSYLERAVQHLFPSELSHDQEQRVREDPSLNPRAREFRPVRRAAAVAVENIRRIVEEEAVEH